MIELIERYRHSRPSDLIHGEVAGLALPFNVSDARPGLMFDEKTLTVEFFAYSVYDAEAFKEQLDRDNPLDRVHFMWQHGLEGGMTAIPIGNVLSLVATPEALMFRAELNNTEVADELRKALSAVSVKEISVRLQIRDFRMETDGDSETFRRVTKAEVFDVSLVVNGQFLRARIFEVLCDGCGQVKSLHDEHMPHSNDEPAPITRKQLGELYAQINDLQEKIAQA